MNSAYKQMYVVIFSGETLYFCDAAESILDSVNIDGTHREQLYSDHDLHCYGMLFDQGYLYISSWDPGYVLCVYFLKSSGHYRCS